MKAQDAWLLSLKPPATIRVRLFCFPHAGGGASVYARWAARVPPDVHVCPVQLPGRENRYDEPLPQSAASLVTSIATQVPFGDEPFAFFGHSMGATLAFEVTRALRRAGRRLPRMLIASANTPPQGGYKHITLHQVSGDALMRQLRLYGTTEAVLAHQELLDLSVPVIQGDSRLVNDYQYVPEPPLPVPIVVYRGEGDPTLRPERLEGWREQTSARFSTRVFPGGHMYLHPGGDSFFSALAEDLASIPT